MKYARIISDRAVDVSENPADEFHANLAAEFVQVPADVDRGWILTAGVWSAPPPAPAPVAVPPKVSPIEFKLLFTSAERVKLAALRATDVILADFFGIIDDPRLTQVDLALKSTQDGVGYAVGQLVVAGTIAQADAAGRIEQILSGQPQ